MLLPHGCACVCADFFARKQALHALYGCAGHDGMRFLRGRRMRMKKSSRIILALACAAVLVTGLAVGTILWRTDYAETKVLTASSADGQYSLTVCMVGEPDFPYGETHCRAALYQGGEKLTELDFSVRNDGAAVREDNFSVVWEETAVTLLASGTEQEDAAIVLHY